MRKPFAFVCVLLLAGCGLLPWTTQHSVSNAEGDTYSGSWKYATANGQGSMTFADGSKYTGGWQDGKPTGQRHRDI